MAIGRSEAKHMLLPIIQRNLKYGYSVLVYPSLVTWAQVSTKSLADPVFGKHLYCCWYISLADQSHYWTITRSLWAEVWVYRLSIELDWFFQSLASFLWGCDLATVSVLPPQYLYQSTFPAARLCVSHSHCLLGCLQFLYVCVLRSKSLYAHF